MCTATACGNRQTTSGLATQDWALTLEARGPVVNPGVKDSETGEFLRFVTTMQDGDKLRLYRESGQLKLEQIINGTGYDVFSTLDGSSTLWTLRHGTQAWQRTADSGDGWLFLSLTMHAAFTTIITEGSNG